MRSRATRVSVCTVAVLLVAVGTVQAVSTIGFEAADGYVAGAMSPNYGASESGWDAANYPPAGWDTSGGQIVAGGAPGGGSQNWQNNTSSKLGAGRFAPAYTDDLVTVQMKVRLDVDEGQTVWNPLGAGYGDGARFDVDESAAGGGSMAVDFEIFNSSTYVRVRSNGGVVNINLTGTGQPAMPVNTWFDLVFEINQVTQLVTYKYSQSVGGALHTLNDGAGTSQFAYKNAGSVANIAEVGWGGRGGAALARAINVDDVKIGPTPAPPAPCDTTIVLTSGVEKFTAVVGSSPTPIVYGLFNGGSLSHDYNVDELGEVAHSIAGLFNTGVDASGAPLGDQAPDPHYTLTVNPDSAGSQTYTSLDDGFPIPPWITNNATSRWITVRPDNADSEGAPGQYTYRTTFTAPGSNTTLYGLLAVDNALTDVLINGVSAGVQDNNQFASWTLFRLDLAAADNTLDFKVTNSGTADNSTGLRVEFFGLSQQDQTWLSVAPGNPITVPSQTTAPVTATITTAGLPAGVHAAYLRFTNLDDCDPLEDPILRRIEMTLSNWEVTPADGASLDIPLSENCPGRPPEQVQFTVANLGSTGNVTYTVEKLDGCDWLVLDKTGQIEVGPGLTDQVTGTIDLTGLAAGDYTCTLLFTNVGTGLPKEVRTVTLHVVGTVWEYRGDVDPLNADSAGPGLNFIVHSESPMPVEQGQVEDDPLATDGKVWRLTDSGTAKTKFRSQPDTWVSGQLGATLVARMRVYSYGPDLTQGLALGIWDDVTGDSAEIFYGGSGGILKELRRGQSAAVAGDDQFHVVRMTIKGTTDSNRTIKVYFDENPTPVISITSASGSTTSIDGFVFGAGSTAGQIDVAFDWLTATDVGAFAPGEEVACLGRSLVIDACPTPFADADEDGDVDQSDFAAFEVCYTGSPPGASYDAEKCHCFDRNHDGDVDEHDLSEFEYCATGPGVLWSQQLEPDCTP
jgi:hypothetical protein